MRKSKSVSNDAMMMRLKVALFTIVLVLLVAIPIIGISTLITLNEVNTTLATLKSRLDNVTLENTSLDAAIDRIDDAISKMESAANSAVDTQVSDTTSNTEVEKTPETDIFPSAYDVQVTAEEGLRVRTQPNLTSDIIAVIPYNTILTITDNHQSDWYQTGDKYQNGYIYKSYTTTEIDESATVEIAPKATPLSSGAMNIYEPSNLTADEFNNVIATFAADRSINNSVLLNAGEALVELEQNHGFNGLFALSVSGLESGFGITYAAQNYNNPLGIMVNGKIKSFDTLAEAFDYYGNFMSKYYFGSGRNTISSIGQKYCPSTATKWAEDVSWFWNKLTTYA